MGGGLRRLSLPQDEHFGSRLGEAANYRLRMAHHATSCQVSVKQQMRGAMNACIIASNSLCRNAGSQRSSSSTACVTERVRAQQPVGMEHHRVARCADTFNLGGFFVKTCVASWNCPTILQPRRSSLSKLPTTRKWHLALAVAQTKLRHATPTKEVNFVSLPGTDMKSHHTGGQAITSGYKRHCRPQVHAVLAGITQARRFSATKNFFCTLWEG